MASVCAQMLIICWLHITRGRNHSSCTWIFSSIRWNGTGKGYSFYILSLAIWISTWHHFSSAWRGSFNFSYSLGLLVRNSLSFHFTVVFVLPLFLKVIFAICTFLSWQIFFFSALQCYYTVFWPLFWWQIAFICVLYCK